MAFKPGSAALMGTIIYLLVSTKQSWSYLSLHKLLQPSLQNREWNLQGGSPFSIELSPQVFAFSVQLVPRSEEWMRPASFSTVFSSPSKSVFAWAAFCPNQNLWHVLWGAAEDAAYCFVGKKRDWWRASCLSAASRGKDLEKEVLSSSPWDPTISHGNG